MAKQEKALRYNKGKLRYDLIPWQIEQEDARVFTAGAEKYADWDWSKGFDYSTPLAAARRHIAEYQKGNTHDDETGCHHMALAAWNLRSIVYFDMTGKGNNDIVR